MAGTLIRGGTVFDGTGSPPAKADILIHDDKIAAFGLSLRAASDHVIEADGLIVTPGFVDIHTHYDGQLTWDDGLEPSASHGVTTVVTGNCGVGFAPVRPQERDLLIALMEGVEDIPGTALHEGIAWEWETFPQFLDALATRSYAMDVGAMVPHGALRAYAMGERGVANESATDADLDEMATLVEQAVLSGALGFSTSRVLEHQSTSGEVVPGTFADERELSRLIEPLSRHGAGMVQMVPLGVVGGVSGQGIGGASDSARLQEAELAVKLAQGSRRPVTYSLVDDAGSPGLWQEVVALFEQANRAGARLFPQVSSRGVGSLTGFSGNHMFQRRWAYRAIEDLPFSERMAQLTKPEVRKAILTDSDSPPGSSLGTANRHLMFSRLIDRTFPMGAGVGPEPTADQSVVGLARAAGMSSEEWLYDYFCQDGGKRFAVMLAANYNGASYDTVREMIASPSTVLGLSDAGAHVSVLCDASNPTFQLAFWGRDRVRGKTLPLELLVHKQTAKAAEIAGLHDRGIIAVGKRADINIIDMTRLGLSYPYMAHDLPLGGGRILQKAEGYVATLVAGVITRWHDTDTGARPGRLVRGAGYRSH